MNNDPSLNNNSLPQSEEEIDIKKILNIILRNKNLVVFFTLLFLVLSGTYSLSKKKIWEGTFQIVVKQEKGRESGGLSLSRELILENLTGKSSNLKTEVGIIQSSSVLMPVYEFYKKERFKIDPNYKEIPFPSWKNQLEVSLQKSTSIVDIAYRDNNKFLINKVLDKTIEIYQEYSGKGKRRNLELANDYLTQQIEFYKKKSSESIKTVQQFAIDQDLTMLDYGLSTNNGGSVSSLLSGLESDVVLDLGSSPNNSTFGENVNIELARVKAANEIRNIDIKIKKIEALEENDGIDELSYINLTIPKLDGNDTINDLNKLDLQILDLQSKYTDKFPELERLYEKRKLLIGLLKDKSIGLLKAQKVSAEAILEAATRPKGVLLKYKELVREANRDDNTLIQLENRLRGISLQQAKLEDPWELITSPRISGKPVAPNTLLITLVGTLLGFVSGFVLSLLKEKKTGFVFEKDILESFFKTKVIDNIAFNKLNSKSSVNQFFIKDILRQNQDKSFKFYLPNHLDKLDSKSLKLIFENNKNNCSIIRDFADIQDNQIIILVSMIPGITFEELKEIKRKIEILEKEFFGIIVLND